MMSSVPFYERYPTKDHFLYRGMPLTGFLSSKERLEKVPHFEILEDDVCLATYPRTGTRWTAEILSWIINDGDEEEMKAGTNIERCPYLEMSPPGTPNIVDDVDAFLSEKQRLYCTHLRFEMAPQQLALKGKIICVLRNPKDSAVSFYHFYRMNNVLGPYEGTWEEFLKGFSRGEIEYGSYFDFVNSWWERRNQTNILFLRYEEMKRNPATEVNKMAEFLGKSLSEEIIDLIVQKTSFQSMKEDPNANVSRNELLMKQKIMRQDAGVEFIRKGQVGDWKNYFTVAQNEEFDRLVKDKLKGTELVFEY